MRKTVTATGTSLTISFSRYQARRSLAPMLAGRPARAPATPRGRSDPGRLEKWLRTSFADFVVDNDTAIVGDDAYVVRRDIIRYIP